MVARFAWSAVVWLGALGATVALAPYLQRANFIFFWLALLFAAWYGGIVPALVAALAAVLAVNYLFVAPLGQLRIGPSADLLTLAIFSGAALLVSALAAQLARAQREAEASAGELAALARTLEEANAELAAQGDVAEEARQEAEAARDVAERARAAADTANRAKSEFLATMSHEIRTPINAITGYAQLLELGIAGPVTELQRDYLTRLAGSARHLLGLVDDVLDLAKVDAGELRIARERALTGPAVAAALDLVRPQAEMRAVRLIDTRPGELGEPYLGDEHRVRQVLVNLLSNAVKFTEPGGVVRVTCGCAREGARARAFVQVTDTGVGIAAAQHDAVFEPFHQVESGHTRAHGGTGLGLAISRRLARLMGGDLTLESAPGAGSTFTLWLPAAEVRAAASAHDGAAVDVPTRDVPTRGAPDAVAADATGVMEATASSAAPAHGGDRRTPPDAVALDRRLGALAAERVVGLAELGEHLRRHVDPVVTRQAERLRTDDAFPQATLLRRAELEDHQLSFLADLAQTLVTIEETGGNESDLLRDGSAIQRLISELHGRMRQRRGWTAALLEREYAILGEELEAVTRHLASEATGDVAGASVETALGVLRQLMRRATETAVRGLRNAEAEAESPRE